MWNRLGGRINVSGIKKRIGRKGTWNEKGKDATECPKSHPPFPALCSKRKRGYYVTERNEAASS